MKTERAAVRYFPRGAQTPRGISPRLADPCLPGFSIAVSARPWPQPEDHMLMRPSGAPTVRPDRPRRSVGIRQATLGKPGRMPLENAASAEQPSRTFLEWRCGFRRLREADMAATGSVAERRLNRREYSPSSRPGRTESAIKNPHSHEGKCGTVAVFRGGLLPARGESAC